jgi:hypothetical protein
MYLVTLNKLNAVLKVSAQAGQSGPVNKTSVESTAQDDDFQEEKRRKRQISNDTSQAANKSTKTILTTATAKLPPKVVLTRNFLSPLRINDMDMETTDAEKKPPE